MSLSWKIALLAAFLWGLGWAWFLISFGLVGRNKGEDERALREAQIMAWSEDRTREVMERFPKSPGPAVIYAEHALKRKDYLEAARRYQLAIDRNRRAISGYLGAGRALRDAGRLDESEAILRLAFRRFPRDQQLLSELAISAQRRRDWPETARRWERYRKHFPMEKTGYIRGAEALRMAGRVADADALAAEAAARFPEPAAAATAGG